MQHPEAMGGLNNLLPPTFYLLPFRNLKCSFYLPPKRIYCRRMISSRLGPLESMVRGQSISFSMNSTYCRHFSGRS